MGEQNKVVRRKCKIIGSDNIINGSNVTVKIDINQVGGKKQEIWLKGNIMSLESSTEIPYGNTTHCLEIVQSGGTYIEQYMAEAQNKIDSIVSVLSKQERNIFEAILQEKSNKEICDELFISPRTVENYTSRLYAKIGVKSREELIERFK